MSRVTNTRIRLTGMAAIASLAVYAAARVYYLQDIHGVIGVSFAFLLLCGEIYMVAHALGYIFNTLRLTRKQHGFQYKHQSNETLPSVAVVVPVKHEPSDVVERTFIALTSMDYPHMSVYVLDDSTKPHCIKEVQRLARKYKMHYFHPSQLHGAKAGILNDFVKVMTQEYLAVFDADQNPMPDFLRKVVSIAESSHNIAFVQTPQVYTNIDASRIARSAEMQQSVFYETLCEGKSVINAMFCCGTNVLIRRSALVEAGGFREDVITEDFATSVRIHMLGYRSVYYNHARVFGMAPEGFKSYCKQQARWAGGVTRVLRSILYHLVTSPRSLSFIQWCEYLLSSTYYFVGWAFFLLMLCPILYLLFGIPSYTIGPAIYLATFIPYFVWNLSLFYGTMRKRHYRSIDIFRGQIMSSLCFPIFMQATALGLMGKRMTFVVTPKNHGDRFTLLELWPWIVMIALNVLAIAVGVTKFALNPYAVVVNSVWCVYHCIILSQVFPLNYSREKVGTTAGIPVPLWPRNAIPSLYSSTKP